MKTIEKVCKARGGIAPGSGNGVRKADIEIFPGFKSAIEACLLDWDDYPIQGVTFSDSISRRYYLPYCSSSRLPEQPHLREINSSAAVLNCEHPLLPCASMAPAIKLSRTVGISQSHHDHRGLLSPRHARDVRILTTQIDNSNGGNDGNRSSISSEGFCENEHEGPGGSHDSDSIEEDFATNCVSCVSSEFSRKDGGSSHPLTVLLPVDSSNHDSSVNPSYKTYIEHTSSEKNLISNLNVSINEIESSEQNPNRATSTLSGISSQPLPATETGLILEKDKSSPDDQDSDWSSAPESGHKPLVTNRTTMEHRDPNVKFVEQSESQQSSDEYQVYYYDPKAKLTAQERPKERKPEESNIFGSIKRIEDPLEVMDVSSLTF